MAINAALLLLQWYQLCCDTELDIDKCQSLLLVISDRLDFAQNTSVEKEA